MKRHIKFIPTYHPGKPITILEASAIASTCRLIMRSVKASANILHQVETNPKAKKNQLHLTARVAILAQQAGTMRNLLFEHTEQLLKDSRPRIVYIPARSYKRKPYRYAVGPYDLTCSDRQRIIEWINNYQ